VKVTKSALSTREILQGPRILTFLAVLLCVNAWLNTKTLNNGVSDWFDWNRQVVVLPGSSNGIGRQMAHLLSDRGIKVAILDIHPPQKDLSCFLPTVRFHKCDVTSPSAIAAIAAAINGTLGQPTVPISNDGACTGNLQVEVNPRADYGLRACSCHT
jgi:all-trans-retinol dehydrogenase (NAD+)